jgi:hypothetical protein
VPGLEQNGPWADRHPVVVVLLVSAFTLLLSGAGWLATMLLE